MPKRILIIDDHKQYCQMVCDILKNRGYEAETCLNITSAFIETQISTYDLIILDLNMPQLTGIDIIKQIQEKNIQIPILVISGYITPEIEKKLQQLGILHTVSKPFPTHQLLLTMASIFAIKKPPIEASNKS